MRRVLSHEHVAIADMPKFGYPRIKSGFWVPSPDSSLSSAVPTAQRLLPGVARGHTQFLEEYGIEHNGGEYHHFAVHICTTTLSGFCTTVLLYWSTVGLRIATGQLVVSGGASNCILDCLSLFPPSGHIKFTMAGQISHTRLG